MTTGPWLTAAALAGLPGLPASERRTRDWLARTRVPQRQAAGKHGGGGVEWDCSALPEATRAALMLRQIEAVAPATPVAPQLATAPQLAPDRKTALPAVTITPRAGLPAPPAARVASRQEAACADARLALLNQAYALQAAGRSLEAAFNLLAHQLASPQAPADLLALASAANQRQRRGGAAPVSAKTLWKWHALHTATGWAGLLPAPVLAKPLASLPDDVAAVLARYHSTSGAARNLSHCAQAVNTELGRPHDDWRALAHRARRALPKVDKVGLIKARHTGAERDAKLPYKRRDTSVLVPNDVWLIDGHTFKAKVRHPFHGQPFAPEVTVVIDAADRFIVGWSISLSENTIAVGDAVRVAVTRAGTTPAMIYSDGGSGETGKMLDCPVAGIYNRLGISHPVGLPGKPQGHGLIERSWRTTMIRAARQYGSYQGGDADSHTVRNVRLELGREATAVKRAQAAGAEVGSVVKLSAKVPGWQQFMADVAAEVERYNTVHRHRGLPKHTSGPHAGKHMTPAEARAAMAQPIDDVLRVTHATAVHLFMPAMVRTPSRGWVTLENKQYFSEALMANGVDGERCRVHYDIHDPAKVWVWTLAGTFVCEAGLEANTIDYMPLSALQLAREKRTRAAVKRLEQKIDTAMAELNPQLQAPVAGMVFNAPQQPAELAPVAAQQHPADTPALQAGRPAFFESAADRYEWLMQHPAAWGDGDATWLADYAASTDYAALAGYFSSRGIAWPDEGDSPGFSQAG